MAMHALAFLGGLEVKTCDVPGFSLGGMVAQQIAQDRPSILSEDDPRRDRSARRRRHHAPGETQAGQMPKIFFALTESSQAAGEAFIGRLAKRKEDLEPASGPEVAAAQIAANLPNAVLLTYPDSGHGSLFQFHDSFTRQATAFLASDSPFAPY